MINHKTSETHCLDMDTPATIWNHGFPIGNGDLGACHFADGLEGHCTVFENEFKYGINKYGVNDRRLADKQAVDIPHETVCKLLKDENWDEFSKIIKECFNANMIYPTPKPAGELIITDLTPENYQHFHESLDMDEAIIHTDYEYSFGKSKVQSFICANRNVLAVRHDDINKHSSDPRVSKKLFRRKVSVHRWRDTVDPTMTDAKLNCDDNYIWAEHTFPDGFSYVTMATVKGVGFKTKVNGFRAEVFLKSYHQGHMEVYMTTVTSLESDDPLAEAKKILTEAVQAGWDTLITEHKQWWSDFWSVSSVKFGQTEKLYEEMWYFSIYILSSCSRPGKLPPGLFGLWNAFDNAPWRGYYVTDSNVEMTFWPLYTANHLELGESFQKMYFDLMPVFKAETKMRYNCDGMKIPGYNDDLGREFTKFPCSYMFSGGGRTGLLFWWAYEFSHDKELLENTVYPFIKEVVKFYISYMHKGDDGLYHIWPSLSPEQTESPNYGLDTDPTIDIAVIKSMFEAAVKSCEILNVDKDFGSLCKDHLDNLPEYNTGINYRGKKVWLDTAEAKADRIIYHASLLYPVFPCGEIDQDTAMDKKEVALESLAAMESQCIHNQHYFAFHVAAVAARMGQVDRALELLDLQVVRSRMENGLFSSSNRLQRTEIFAIESSSGPATVINEMLLQSQNGIIKIFPATPGNWSVRFKKLRSRGGFLVSASHVFGSMEPGPRYDYSGGFHPVDPDSKKGISEVEIESTVGSTCRLKNPWPAHTVCITDTSSNNAIYTGDDDLIMFETEKDHTYKVELVK